MAQALSGVDLLREGSAGPEAAAQGAGRGGHRRRLLLSARTVESHVPNILTKLGLANRTQLAAAVLRDVPATPG